MEGGGIPVEESVPFCLAQVLGRASISSDEIGIADKTSWPVLGGA